MMGAANRRGNSHTEPSVLIIFSQVSQALRNGLLQSVTKGKNSCGDNNSDSNTGEFVGGCFVCLVEGGGVGVGGAMP